MNNYSPRIGKLREKICELFRIVSGEWRRHAFKNCQTASSHKKVLQKKVFIIIMQKAPS